MKNQCTALVCALILFIPAFAGESLEEDRQSVLLIAGYDGTIRAVQDVIPLKGDGIIDLRDEASLGVSAAFPPKMAGQFAFTDLAVKNGVILATDVQNHYMVFQDLYFKQAEEETISFSLWEEPWSVLIRGETIIYGMRYAPSGQAPYAISWLHEGPNGTTLRRHIPSGGKFPTACTALEKRIDGSVLCLDTSIASLPRPGRLWLIPGDIRNPKGLGDPVMIYESSRLVSMAVDENNQVFVALAGTDAEKAEIRRLEISLRSKSVVGEQAITWGNLLHFDPQMANAFVFQYGQAYIGVNWVEPDGSQLHKVVVRFDPITGDQSLFVSADVVGTNNPIALTFWP